MIKLLTSDINDIRRKLINWFERQAITNSNSKSLIQPSSAVNSMQDIVAILHKYYIGYGDAYYALRNMGIIGGTNDLKQITSHAHLYMALNAAWAQANHKFDDGETDILRI